MRKIRRKTKRNKVLVITASCLLLCLCVGYAAFQTNITITAKGNIIDNSFTIEDLKEKVTNSGDGLYKDEYEDDRYVYKGIDPNNYIWFNNERWRIIAIESNGTLKIVRNDVLDKTMAFDTAGYRTDEYCSLDHAPANGCNAWAKIDYFSNGSYSGTVLADSSLNTYLNGDYYDSLSDTAQSYIVSYTYNIGAVGSSAVNNTNYTMKDQLDDEDDYTWTGKVALINLSDYIRSNSNAEGYCDRAYGNYYSNYETCRNTTWMYISGTIWWTITPYGIYTSHGWPISSNGAISYHFVSDYYGIRPVVHLKSSLKLSGSGTYEDPFQINS